MQRLQAFCFVFCLTDSRKERFASLDESSSGVASSDFWTTSHRDELYDALCLTLGNHGSDGAYGVGFDRNTEGYIAAAGLEFLESRYVVDDLFKLLTARAPVYDPS
jgi:hypothetical protein